MGWTRAPSDSGDAPAPAGVRAFDARFDALAERGRGPLLDPFFFALSSAADHSLLWHLVGSWRARTRRDPAWALRFSAVLGVESALTNGVMKAAFRRVRPEPPVAEGPLPMGMRRPVTSSFPSGHATAAFTAATILSADGNTFAWYALATLVAYSRVHVRMHHGSDVVVGAVCGLAFGRVARRVLS